MSNKIKKGFTIVELLIVIVVMGILATIVIVTYQGVQDKANTTKNQSNAKEVVAKAEAYNSLKTGYAEDAATLKAETDSAVKMSGEVVTALQDAAGTIGGQQYPKTGDDRKKVYYNVCSDNTGIRVQYYDYDKKQNAKIDSGTCTDAWQALAAN